jgi:hypothetical protein
LCSIRSLDPGESSRKATKGRQTCRRLKASQVVSPSGNLACLACPLSSRSRSRQRLDDSAVPWAVPGGRGRIRAQLDSRKGSGRGHRTAFCAVLLSSKESKARETRRELLDVIATILNIPGLDDSVFRTLIGVARGALAGGLDASQAK